MNKKLSVVIKVLLIGIIVVFTIILDMIFLKSIENFARYEAKNQLVQFKYCVDKLVSLNKLDKLEIFKICGSKVKTTYTGDLFVFGLYDKKFYFDPSKDCDIPNKKLDSNLCQIFYSPESCEKAEYELLKGYDTINTQNDVYWIFDKDGGKEWLEWIVLPEPQKGYNGIYRGWGTDKNHLIKPEQYVAVLGIKEKEVMKYFSLYRYMYLGFSGLLIILIVIICSIIEIIQDRIKNC